MSSTAIRLTETWNLWSIASGIVLAGAAGVIIWRAIKRTAGL
jgi:LPXTG-motif cell wall-anchored protein